MKKDDRIDTVVFTVKGQVVIPQWLRREFEIAEGTRAVVYREGDHIVMRPMTAAHYKSLRGSLKGKGLTKALDHEPRNREHGNGGR